MTREDILQECHERKKQKSSLSQEERKTEKLDMKTNSASKQNQSASNQREEQKIEQRVRNLKANQQKSSGQRKRQEEITNEEFEKQEFEELRLLEETNRQLQISQGYLNQFVNQYDLLSRRLHELMLVIQLQELDQLQQQIQNVTNLQGRSDLADLLQNISIDKSYPKLDENELQNLRSEAYQGDQKIICTICLVKVAVGEEVRILQCNHKFHISCVDVWLKQKAICPNCNFCLK